LWDKLAVQLISIEVSVNLRTVDRWWRQADLYSFFNFERGLLTIVWQADCNYFLLKGTVKWPWPLMTHWTVHLLSTIRQWALRVGLYCAMHGYCSFIYLSCNTAPLTVWPTRAGVHLELVVEERTSGTSRCVQHEIDWLRSSMTMK
jgi:hypothetical protein